MHSRPNDGGGNRNSGPLIPIWKRRVCGPPHFSNVKVKDLVIGCFFYKRADKLYLTLNPPGVCAVIYVLWLYFSQINCEKSVANLITYIYKIKNNSV